MTDAAEFEPDVKVHWCPLCGPVFRFAFDGEQDVVVHEASRHPDGPEFAEPPQMH